MADRLLRAELFVVSYVPLFTILAFRTMPSAHDTQCALRSHDVWALRAPLLFMILTTAGLTLVALILRHARRISGTTLTISSVSDRGREAAAYLSTYILPFVMFDEDSWQVWAAFSVYLIVLAIITVSSDLILTNPTLYLLRRRVIEVEAQRSRGPGDSFAISFILICKNAPEVGDKMDAIEFAGGYLEKVT